MAKCVRNDSDWPLKPDNIPSDARSHDMSWIRQKPGSADKLKHKQGAKDNVSGRPIRTEFTVRVGAVPVTRTLVPSECMSKVRVIMQQRKTHSATPNMVFMKGGRLEEFKY